MCSSKIVHSGRQHRGPTWGKRLYCDGYLTRRPARCAGATASFNFTKLRGQLKSARGCSREGRESERRQRRHAREVEWERKWSSSVAKRNCEEISQPVFLTTVRRGILSGGCSHFLIPSKYILRLTSKPLRWLPKTAHFFSREGRPGGGGASVTQAQRPHCDCQSSCVRPRCMSSSLSDLRRLARKTQDLPAEWGNTHGEGRNGTGGHGRSLTSSKCRLSCFC